MLQPQPGLNQVPTHATEDDDAGDQDCETQTNRHIGEAEEAVAEAVDDVEDWIEFGDSAPDAGQGVGGVEDATEVQQWGEDEGWDDVDAVDGFGVDTV